MIHYAPKDLQGLLRWGRGSVCDYRMTLNRTDDPERVTCRKCLRWMARNRKKNTGRPVKAPTQV